MDATGQGPMVLSEAILIQWRFPDISDPTSLEHPVSFITVVLRTRDCNCYPNLHQSSPLHSDRRMEGQTLASPIQWGRLRNNGLARFLSSPHWSQAMRKLKKWCEFPPNPILYPSPPTNAHSSMNTSPKARSNSGKVCLPFWAPPTVVHIYNLITNKQWTIERQRVYFIDLFICSMLNSACHIVD